MDRRYSKGDPELECNVLIGLMLGMPRQLVDLPSGYAGEEYCKDFHTLKDALRKVYERMKKMKAEGGG